MIRFVPELVPELELELEPEPGVSVPVPEYLEYYIVKIRHDYSFLQVTLQGPWGMCCGEEVTRDAEQKH